MKSTLLIRYGELRQLYSSAFYLSLGILFFSACNFSPQREAITFKEKENYYLAEATDYELALSDNRIEIFTEGKNFGSTITFAGEQIVTPTLNENGNVHYEDIFDRTDLIFYDKGNGNAGYDFILAANADPYTIKMQVGQNASLTKEGALVIPIEGGIIKHSQPYAYQEIEGEKIEVDSRFALAEGILSFELGEYNTNYGIVIDPMITYEKNELSESFAPGDVCTNGVSSTEIEGTVWMDNDYEGDFDESNGVKGMVIYAYNDCNGIVDSTITNVDGDYSFTGLDENVIYRVEFRFPDSLNYLSSTKVGADNGGTVQFTMPGECVSLGVINAAEYCEEDPLLFTPCYVQDDNLVGDNNMQTVGVAVRSNASGNSAMMFLEVPANEMGSTYGVAYQRSTQQLFTSSYVKRKSGLGPDGNGGTTTGGIYRIANDGGTTASASLLIDLNPIVNTGSDPHPLPTDMCTSGTNGATDNDNCWLHDANTYDKVGRIGLGDLEISPDQTKLFTVNLNDRTLVEIEIGEQVSTVSASDVSEYDLSAYFSDCSDSDWLPFALGKKDGKMYLGATCTAETSQDLTNLDALLYEFDPNNPGILTLISRFDLDYTRVGQIRSRGNNTTISANPESQWQYWSDQFDLNDQNNSPVTYYTRNNDEKIEVIHPQPIFSDIEFIGDDLIIALRDRAPDQYADDTGNPIDISEDRLISAVSAGEILCASANGTTGSQQFTLESGGVCGLFTNTFTNTDEGPGGDEFFDDNNSNRISGHQHDEIGFGGLAIITASSEIAMTQMNPTNSTSSGGIGIYNRMTGIQDEGIRLYERSSAPYSFSKAAGLGDLEALCSDAILQIGNYVWQDDDADGIQDACESGINGVPVELYDENGILVASTTTDANGQYYFTKDGTPNETWVTTGDSLEGNTDYFIVFGNGQYDTTNDNIDINGIAYEVTADSIGTAPTERQNDSNPDATERTTAIGSIPVGLPFISYTTGNRVDHSLDFGLRQLGVCSVTLAINVNACSQTGTNPDVFETVYDVEVSWENAPSGEQISVLLDGSQLTTIDATALTSPQTVQVTVPADGTGTNTIRAEFATTTTCGTESAFKAPVPCVSDLGSVTGDICTDNGGLTTSQVGGSVWEDLNYNGVQDETTLTGVAGVKVYAYNDCDNATDSTYTDANGNYIFDGLTASTTYRIEFELPETIACWAKPTKAGADNGTSVQFVQPGNCASMGISSPDDYCQENPFIAISCYENGVSNPNTNKGIVSFTYNSSGSLPAVGEIAKVQDIGTVWGAAYQQSSQRLFMASFLKRHSSFGPTGPGGVYTFDFNANSGVTNVLGSFDLQGVQPSNGGNILDFGTVTRTTVAGSISAGAGGDNELSEDPTEPSRDLDALDKVGKMSYGNIEYHDGKLYLINLFERSIITLETDNPTHSIPTNGSTPSGDIVERYLFSDLSGLPTCNNGELRPFAVAFHHGIGYLGSVCSGENGGILSDVTGYIHQFDPNNISAGFTEILNFPFNANREFAWSFSGGIGDFWTAWKSGWSPDKNFSDNGADPQPIVADIEFTETGDLVIGIIDRFSYQAGHLNYEGLSGNTQEFKVSGAGDILRACQVDGNYYIEGSVQCPTNDLNSGGDFKTNDGPLGAGEFYYDDYFDQNTGGADHLEISLGGLALFLGTNEVLNTVYDPLNGQGNSEFRTQGVHWYATQTGALADNFKIVEQSDNNSAGTQGKGAGLGEPIIMCSPAPLEIGNYVWCDSIANGIQDACERGLDDIIVQLYDRTGVLVGQDTTSNSGQYYFNQNNVDTTGITVNGSGVASPVTAWSGMSYSTQYFIVFGDSQFATDEFTVSSDMYGITPMVNAGTNDNIDSDVDGSSLTSGSLGARPDGLPFIDMMTSATGCGDHKYDLGITCTESCDSSPTCTIYRDDFNNASGSESYDNQDGNTNWLSDWIETNDDGDVALGDVQINGNNELRFDNDDATPPCVERDFTFTASSAVINLFFFFDGTAANPYDANDVFNIEISDDGGTNYTTLASISGADYPAATTGGDREDVISVDITSYSGSNLKLRLCVGSGFADSGEFIYVDFIEVVACPIGVDVTTAVGSPACAPGMGSGSFTVLGHHGLPPFEYSIDGTNFQTSILFDNLAPGDYTITVRDANGETTSCDYTLATLTEPLLPTSCIIDVSNATATTDNYFISFSEDTPVITGGNETDFASITGNVLNAADSTDAGYDYTITMQVSGGPNGNSSVNFPFGDNQQSPSVHDTGDPNISSSGNVNILINGFNSTSSPDTYRRDLTTQTLVRLTLDNSTCFENSTFAIGDMDARFYNPITSSSNFQDGEINDYKQRFTWIDRGRVISGAGTNNYTVGSNLVQLGDIFTPRYPDTDGDFYVDAAGDYNLADSDTSAWVFINNPNPLTSLSFIYDDPGYGIEGDPDRLHDFDAINQFMVLGNNVTFSQTSYTFCDNSSATLNANCPTGSNIIWFNSADVQVGTGSTLIVDVNTNGMSDGTESFYYTVEDANGCVVETCSVLLKTSSCDAAIGNYVWIDEDSDGLQDEGEVGIPNIKMLLKDMNGDVIDSTLTASDGSYLFPDLLPAMYFVMVDESTLPEGMTQTTIYTKNLDGSDADTDLDDGDFGNKDNTANGSNGYKITLDEGEENLTADFGYNYNPTDDVNMPSGSPLAALGDRVWYDANQDGVQDPEEAGVEGVKLKLITNLNIVSGGLDLNGDGVVDITDDGMVVADDGTTMLTVTDGAIVGASTETIGGFNIVGGQLDTDGSGAISAADTNQVKDITIGMATTNANGYYLFDGLFPGAYNIMVADDANGTGTGGPLDGFEQTGDPDHFATSEADNLDDSVENDNMTTKPVVLGPGDVFLNVDFGYDNDTALGAIGDYIWLDADTDGNGTNAAGATGVAVNQGAGGADDAVETPIEGVTVALIKDTNGDGKWDTDEPIIASDVTDQNGLYYFPGLPAGNGEDYLVVITDTENVLDGLKPTYDADGGSMEVDIFPVSQMSNMELGISAVMNLAAGAGNEILDQDFGYTPEAQDAGEGLIGDYIWFNTDGDNMQDDDEAGIEGVKVDLYDLGDDNAVGGTGANADTYLGSTVTDENGYYYFGGLAVDADGESYQVKIAESGSPSGMDNFAAGMVLEGLANNFDPNDMTTSPDNMGGAVLLDDNNPINLDQDFGYTGDNTNTLGSIGTTIWEDTDADGIYEPDGQDGMASTSDDETHLAGVTVDLYRDLNGDGIINPGEPKYGSMTTDAMGMYLFDNLPLGDYIVDVTDEAGVLNGYWHSLGSQDASTNGGNDPMDNSKEDAFALTIDNTTPNNLNVDFGYYKEPAAVGNYVWLDVNGNGLQDDDETGVNDVVVTMTIMYPDGTTITLTDTTRDDASGNTGFYTFPNLLLDEDYRTGAGMQGDDPNTTDPTAAGLPKFVISVDTNQELISGNNGAPTIPNVNSNGNDLEDSDDFDGVLAIPTQGSQNTSAQDPETNETNPIASYDFGITEIKLGAIGNYIWVDEDSDGLQDEGELGIPNIRVILKDDMGNPLDTTYTDSDGKYLFPDLMMGDYFVDVDESTLPTGMSQTTIFTNNVDGDDVDMVTDDGDLGNKDHSGNGYPITLDNGEENLTADFGYNFNPTDDVNNPMGSPTAALGDRIWIDSDGDGVQDPNEVGVSGAEVTLTGPGSDGILGTADDVTQTTTTDENGYYLFDDLTPGAYVTEVTDDTNASHAILGADYEQTGDPDHFATSEADNPDDTVEDDNKVTNPIVLGPGDVYLNADYGYQPGAGAPVGSIGNTVWFDADADGNGPVDSDPIGDGDNGTGTQTDDERPIAGVSVALIADTNGNGIWDDGEDIIATDVTDENGNYLFEGLPIDDNGGDMDADYIVWVNDTDNVLSGLESTFDEDNQAADVPDATGLGDNAANVGGMSAVALDATTPDDRDQDFGYTPAGHSPDEGYIGNYVWFDTDGNDVGGQADAEADMDSGIEGVIMELIYVRTGAMISSTITDENGYYFFGNLPVDLDGEEYQVRVSPDNFLPGGALEALESTFEPDGDNDNEGDPVLLTTAMPGNLDQDFGYTGDDANTLGSIGSTIWEDKDADGIYEPNGTDGTMGTADDETPIEGVTVDLYRDLNGDGIINPDEPKYGTTTTDAMGMYLFDNLPLGDYIVDVTDEAGVLNGYNHSLGSQDASSGVTGDTADDASGGMGGDNSKEDAFAVTIDNTVPNNLNVDFGYYKDAAAVGNYVWVDNDNNGLQDDGETGLNGVVVTMDITYPDDTMITLTDTTRNDASGNPGFYEFPNLLLDEDYRTGAGTGANGEDPASVDPSGTMTPKFVISVDPNQAVFTSMSLVPTMIDVAGGTMDKDDSDAFTGVVAIPVQGSEDTSAQDPETDEQQIASYDFGVSPEMELGAIGNYVWVDEDSDGLQDEGERGIPNVRIILKDDMGNPLDTTYTDASGKYLFPDLMAGNYNVDVDENTLPSGLSQTTIFTNNVDGADTDMVTDDGDLGNKDHSGDGYPITLDAGEENLTADFGYNFNPTDDVNDPMGSPTAALGDRIWIDSNGDGVQDPNEIGVSGVGVTLTGAGPDGILGTADDVTQTTTTDENGYYIFDGLTPGAYVTEVTDDTNASHLILGADFTQTGDPDDFGEMANMPDNQQTDPIVLGPGDVYLNSDYGYQPGAGAAVGSIGNTVWLDADADGNGPADTDLTGNGDGMNGGASVDANEDPIAGVSVSLIQDTNGNGIWDDGEPIIASDVTDENGNYLFEGLPFDDGDGDADYIVWVNDTDNVLDGLKNTFDEDGGVGNDATGVGDDADMVGGMSALALSAGTPDDRNQDFGYTPEGNDAGEGYIGNYVWFDTDGNDAGGQSDAEADMDSGIEGVVMELLDNMGAVIGATTTDENGFYLFGGLPVDADGEMYQVRVAASNFAMDGVLEGLESTFEPDGDNDNEGDLINLTTAMPGNLDQDFGYTSDDANTLGSIGSTIWEDTDADGVYEPDGQDATSSTDDDEDPIAGVTVDLYRDLNGDGVINPGEPKYGTMTTDANGMYLFDNLPLGDYIVDVTDEAGVLNGYNHSLGSQDAGNGVTGDTADDASGGNGGDNSKEDAFAVTIDNTVPNNLNVDFGYYKDAAAVGNYVFADNNANGLQDAGDTPIAGVVVQMDITYPDGTMVTLTDTTDANGFYEFPNLLLDEDYRIGAGTGVDGEDPTGVNAIGTTPKYVISVDPNQMAFTDNNLSPTIADVTSDTNDPLNDSEDFDGVVAIPVLGSENTSSNTNATDASGSSNEAAEAKYDFGAAPQLDLATNIMIMSMTPAQGYYDEDDPITFAVNVFNQGGVPVSDVTITNYLPAELENAALDASSLVINGMPAPMGVTITKVGNDYVIDFGTDPNNWFEPDDELTFKFTADITDGTTPGTEITNTVEISDYDSDNNPATPRPDDVDSVADANNGGDGETAGTGLNDDVTDEDALNNVGDDSDDHDIAIVPSGEVLPVELLGFNAKADKDHIDLVWSTASELNNSHFELERSEDGKVFKSIGRVEGQGTTLELTEYAYEDEAVITNVLYYYRLKQVDYDGAFEYSEIRSAQIEEATKEMELYPNPIGDAAELQVRFYTTELTKEFVVMDIHNRSILQVKQDLPAIGWNTMSIDITSLPAGTYILLDKEGNSKRFVKTRE